MPKYTFELDDLVRLRLKTNEDVGQVVAIITERQCVKYRILWDTREVEEHHESQLRTYAEID